MSFPFEKVARGDGGIKHESTKKNQAPYLSSIHHIFSHQMSEASTSRGGRVAGMRFRPQMGSLRADFREVGGYRIFWANFYCKKQKRVNCLDFVGFRGLLIDLGHLWLIFDVGFLWRPNDEWEIALHSPSIGHQSRVGPGWVPSI